MINSMKSRHSLCCQLIVPNPDQKPKIRGMKPCNALPNFASPKNREKLLFSFQKTAATLVLIPLAVHFINIICMMKSLAEKPFSQSCGEGRAGNIKFFMYAKPFIVNAVYANICSTSLSIRHIGFKAS